VNWGYNNSVPLGVGVKLVSIDEAFSDFESFKDLSASSLCRFRDCTPRFGEELCRIRT
jgi:hypothetical protein